MSHTPGPWQMRDERYCINEILGNLEGPIEGQIRGEKICEMEHTEDGQIFANAKLISAAPEMLSTLRSLISKVDQIDSSGRIMCGDEIGEILSGFTDFIDSNVRAIVQKATGRV